MSLYIDDDGYWCFDWEVPQNEQLPDDTKRPYCCPVCQGRLTMPHGFYEDIPRGSSTSNNTARETCRTCNGTGVIW